MFPVPPDEILAWLRRGLRKSESLPDRRLPEDRPHAGVEIHSLTEIIGETNGQIVRDVDEADIEDRVVIGARAQTVRRVESLVGVGIPPRFDVRRSQQSHPVQRRTGSKSAEHALRSTVLVDRLGEGVLTYPGDPNEKSLGDAFRQTRYPGKRNDTLLDITLDLPVCEFLLPQQDHWPVFGPHEVREFLFTDTFDSGCSQDFAVGVEETFTTGRQQEARRFLLGLSAVGP